MRCGSGRRALTGGGGRAEPAVFGGWGARRFLVDIWGLAKSLVPAYTNSSIFCEKLRSGDAGERDSVSGERGIFCPGAGERDSVSGERGSSSDVSGDCNVLSSTQHLTPLIKSVWMIRIQLLCAGVSDHSVALRQTEMFIHCVPIQSELMGI